MREFVAIDFETANPQRVSACAFGYAKVIDSQIIESNVYLVRPVGGHAPFQSKIHGLTDEHTCDKPHFGELYPQIRNVISSNLVAHSCFDKQVLNALSDHFNLNLKFQYTDSSAMAKARLPTVKSCKLTALVKHFDLPAFSHHDAKEDAIACARVFLKLLESANEVREAPPSDELAEFRGMVKGVLADDEVNYKEAFGLLYWLEDHDAVAERNSGLYRKLKSLLNDNVLEAHETVELKSILRDSQATLDTARAR